MKSTLIGCLISALYFGGVASSFADKRGETAKILIGLKDKPEEALKAARTERDFFTATSAFSYWLESVSSKTGPEAIKDLSNLGNREELRPRIALLLALDKEGEAIAQACYKAGEPRLAAEILLARARLFAASQETNTSLRILNKGGKPAPAKIPPFPPAPPHLPPEWWESPSPEIEEMLLVTAALLKAPDQWTAVQARNPKTPAGAAARAWALAAMDHPLDAQALANIATAAANIPPGIQETGPALSDGSLTDHPLCYVLKAMALGKDEKTRNFVHRQLTHADLRVQQDAVATLRALGAAGSSAAFIAALDQAPWPTFITLTEALQEAPTADAIVPLIKKLQSENGRMRLHIVYTLSVIAGENHGDTAEDWITWYRDAGKTFQVDPLQSTAYLAAHRIHETRVPSVGSFYGLPIFSTAFTFVVDSSGSMKGERIKSLQENLTGTISILKSHVLYNIVDFGADITRLSEKGLLNNEKQTLRYLENIKLTGATRSFEALETGALDDIDTLYFLSDGAPARSQIQAWSKMAHAWRVLYRYRPLALYMIVFDPNPANRQAMDKFAAAFWGLTESPQ